MDQELSFGLGTDPDARIAACASGLAALFFMWPAFNFWLGEMASNSFKPVGGEGALHAWIWPGFEAMRYTSVLGFVGATFCVYWVFEDESYTPLIGLGITLVDLPPTAFTFYLLTRGSRVLTAMAGVFTTSYVELVLEIFIKMPFMKYPIAMLAAGTATYFAHRAAQANYYEAATTEPPRMKDS